MKTWIAIILASALAAQAPAVTAASPADGLPRVAIAHQGLIERYCAAVAAEPPDPRVVAQVGARLDEFRAAWAERGPQLMAAAVAVTAQPYLFSESLATLHACPGMNSMSVPLLIDAGRYIEPAAEGSGQGAPLPPRRLAHFAYTLWHELEHRHVGDILRTLPGRSTPLLELHGGESQVTLNHLHLFAVEQLVFRSLGREDEFHARGREYSNRGNAPYARAYRLVIEIGAEALVDELKPAGRPGSR